MKKQNLITPVLRTLLLSCLLSTTMVVTGQDVQTVEPLPEAIRLTPTTAQHLPLVERQFMMSELEEGQSIEIFQAPPCLEGDYYLGVQLYYDLGKGIASTSLKNDLEVTLWHNGIAQWTKPLSLDISSQQLVATLFNDSEINCDKSYHLEISRKEVSEASPDDNIFFRVLLFRSDMEDFDPKGKLEVASQKGEEDILVSWNYAGNNAASYDLEWIFVDGYDAAVNKNSKELFSERPSVRVTTQMPYFRHLAFYPGGKLYYRVRAIGFDLQNTQSRITGEWTYAPVVTVENNLSSANWEQTTEFSGQGNYSKIVRYLDGQGQERQTIERASGDRFALVRESLYDYEGRKVMEVLPTPMPDGSLQLRNSLSRFDAMNGVVSQNTSALRSKFHYDNGTLRNSSLTGNSEVNRYYGDQYAFHQKAFTSDGRIASQSIGNGEEEKIYYGDAGLEEMKQILGEQVAGAYTKTLRIDAEGSKHIAYFDGAGHEVATAASVGTEAGTAVKIDLVKNQNSYLDQLSTSDFVLVNSMENSPYTFTYHLDTGNDDQVYSLEIGITGPAGVAVDLSHLPGNESSEPTKYIRSKVSSSELKEIELNVVLKDIGSYAVSKKLTLPKRSYDEVVANLLERDEVASAIKRIEDNYRTDMEACAICNDLSEEELSQRYDELQSASTVAFAENLRQRMVEDYRASHGNYSGEISEDSLRTHTLYASYALASKDQASHSFDIKLSQIGTWEEAERKGLDKALSFDPFFNEEGLSGKEYYAQMEEKLQHVIVGTLVKNNDTIEYSGTLLEVINPDNKTLFVNTNGLPDPDGGIHPLYVDLLSRRNQMKDAAYQAAISTKKWNLYRAYYQAAKQAIKAEIPAYQEDALFQEEMSLFDNIKSSAFGEMPIRYTVTQADIDYAMANLQWACNKTFAEEDVRVIAEHLNAYFSNDADNFLHVIIREDIGVDEDLKAIQAILNKYGSDLDFVAQTDRLSCVQDELLDPYAVSKEIAASPEALEMEQVTAKKSTTSRAELTSPIASQSLQEKESRTSKSQGRDWFGTIKSAAGKSTPAREYQALISLYKSAGGAEWHNQKGWSEVSTGKTVNVGDWYGVATDAEGHVIALKLEGNNLRGTLPTELGNLSYLKYLDLGSVSSEGNKLQGKIPASLGQLNQLYYLDLQNNALEGDIPTSLFRLEKLTVLNLGDNKLTGTISKDIEKISGLRTLNVSNNLLTGSVPNEVGKLRNLKYLMISHNRFTGQLPATIGNLGQLVKLDASFNQFSGSIPSTMGGMRRLEMLRLNNNKLEREIPTGLMMLKELHQIDLSFNKLSGALPANLTQLEKVKHLALNNNQFTGKLPATWGNMKGLRSVSLARNRFTGDIPEGVFAPQIEYLDLSGNQLSGGIPASVAQATALTQLSLAENNLEGNVVASFADMDNLTSLALDHNKLTGDLPSTMSSMSSLEILQLDHNSLEGKIPASWGDFDQLEVLTLGYNHLTDSIPQTFGNLQQLTRLDLSNNKFVGPIPESLGKIKGLHELTLDNNELTGQIPASIEGINRLVVLNNHLEGAIPAPLPEEQRRKGNALWLSYNKYSFKDILPIKDQLDVESFIYHRQDSIDDKKTVPLFIDHPFTLVAHVDREVSPACQYQWFKYIEGAEDSVMNERSPQGHTLTLGTVSTFDTGSKYYYTVTHSSIPGLVLVSNLQTVMALSPNSLCANYDPLSSFIWDTKGAQEQLYITSQLEEEKNRHVSAAVQQFLNREVDKELRSFETELLGNLNERFVMTYAPLKGEYVTNRFDLAGNKIASWSGAQKALSRYNSFNQATQETNDGETLTRVFNRQGQLRLSGYNNSSTVSYVKYDAQGRVVENGELNGSITALGQQVDNETFPASKDHALTNVVRTTYDHVMFSDRNIQQHNLRGNIAQISVGDGEAASATVRYSYDVNGKVATLVQEDQVGEAKRLDFVYDAISGQPLYQFFQYNQPDEFIHQFNYDAQDRLVNVATSSDGFVWNNEATYQYYKHGPLAQKELGEYQVQTVSYLPKVVDVSNDSVDPKNAYLLRLSENTLARRHVYGPTGKLVAAYANDELLLQPIYGDEQLGTYDGKVRPGTLILGSRKYGFLNADGQVEALLSDKINARTAGATIEAVDYQGRSYVLKQTAETVEVDAEESVYQHYSSDRAKAVERLQQQSVRVRGY